MTDKLHSIVAHEPKPGMLTREQIMLLSNVQIQTPKELIEPPKPRPRSERSAPVRNPAFRENEALRALQKQLNSRR